MFMLNFMARTLIVAAASIMYVLPIRVSADDQRVQFIPESLSQYTAASLAHHRHVDARHNDATRYHAYRYLNHDWVIIGEASEIAIDAKGRPYPVVAPGTMMSGRPNHSHQEYSHVLLPMSKLPPR